MRSASSSRYTNCASLEAQARLWFHALRELLLRRWKRDVSYEVSSGPKHTYMDPWLLQELELLQTRGYRHDAIQDVVVVREEVDREAR